MNDGDGYPDLWRRLASLTPARIGLGRSGVGMPTAETLRFALAHAQARDAVHAAIDAEGLAEGVRALGLPVLVAASGAPDRQAYLLRPDLGRSLAAESRARLAAAAGEPADLAITIADGLSAHAVQAHALPVLAALLGHARRAGWSLAPVTVATQARVALADEVGALLGARLSLILIGERPGLSTPDSLGLYLTHAPRPGRNDGERNCISNIHGAGLSHEAAAASAAWLIGEALKRGLTGVALKDESGAAMLPEPAGSGGLPRS